MINFQNNGWVVTNDQIRGAGDVRSEVYKITARDDMKNIIKFLFHNISIPTEINLVMTFENRA